MHISPFGVNKEVQLKVPKQGLYKVSIGMYTLESHHRLHTEQYCFPAQCIACQENMSLQLLLPLVLVLHFCPSPRNSKATSPRELFCGHAAPEDASSGQQGEQIELALNHNFPIYQFNHPF